jgi:hypothetical protein
MKKKRCPFEEKVLKSLITGDLEPEIKKHGENCLICQESVSIYKWMSNFQIVSKNIKGTEKELPDAEAIWEGAYSVRRPDKELVNKALRPLIFPQVLSYAAAIIVLCFLVFSNLQGIRNFINTNPESIAIFSSISLMLKTYFKSFSLILLPMVAGLFSTIIFFFITGFELKRLGSLKLPK